MKTYVSIEALESRIAPAGLVMATYDAVTRELVLTGDDASNAVAIHQTGPTTWRVEGREDAGFLNTSINVAGDERFEVGPIAKLTVELRGGDDSLDLINLRSLKSLAVDMGPGADSVETLGLAVKGGATFNTGAGIDIVQLDGLAASVGGNLEINDSADGLTFFFDAASSSVGGRVIFTGSAGPDVLTMATDTNLKIGRDIVFTGNGGFDRLEFGSQGTVSIGRDAQGRSIVYEGGSSLDRLAIGSSKVTLLGSVEMNGAGGNDMLDLDGGIVSIGRSLAGVSVSLTGSAGIDEIDVKGSSFTAAGRVRFDGGTEADRLDISGAHRLVLKAGVSFDGGAGADVLDIGADSLAISGGVTFNGGDDPDTATIDADGLITGAVVLNPGAAAVGTQGVEVTSRSGLPGSLKLNGPLTIDSTAASSSSVDRVKLTNLSLSGPLSMLLSDGGSSVDIDNLSAGGAVSIETRGGNDTVEIERDATFGASLFRKLATIMLGGGDDTLLIGKGSKNNRVLFMANITADGGIGDDSRNDIGADNKYGPAATYSESAFETLVPTV